MHGAYTKTNVKAKNYERSSSLHRSIFKTELRNLESDAKTTTSPGSAFRTLMTLSLKGFS